MKTIKTWFSVAACGLIAASFAFSVAASGLVPCGGPGQEDCTVCHLFKLTKDGLYFSLGLTFFIASLIFIICGLNLMTNRGNVQGAVKTKKIMGATAFGLIMIFAGWVGVNTYFISAGAAEWNGYSLTRDWWKISTKCDKLATDLVLCGDGVVQRETESCDPKETVAGCQGRTGYTPEMCDELISNCDAEKCISQFCGDGKIQSGEDCDPQISVKDCVKNGGKTMAECVQIHDLCRIDCTFGQIVEGDEDDDEGDEAYEKGRCLEQASGAHSPDCADLHTGLDGYKLIVKNFYVAEGSYHDSALSPIEAKGPNGEKICMCFDTCAYPEKFKYVLVDADKRLFDVYATAAGEQVYKNIGEGALMDDTKPVIYLYPEVETNITVKLDPKGKMTASIPPYGEGWNVDVEPNGLIDKRYGYLFYETEIPAAEIDLPFQGFLVAYDELEGFFDTILPNVGLRGQEINDFKNWWLDGRLRPAKFYLIRLLDRETIENIEPMSIEPKPDTVIRVRFLFTPMEDRIETFEPEIKTPERQGYTAVEWGGLVEKTDEQK